MNAFTHGAFCKRVHSIFWRSGTTRNKLLSITRGPNSTILRGGSLFRLLYGCQTLRKVQSRLYSSDVSLKMAVPEKLRNRSLPLTEVEQTLKQLLLDVAKYVNAGNPSQLRFTGGWVRDKILGVDSHDIDIGINDMTGETFGLKMKEYLEIPGNPEKYGLLGVAASDEDRIDAKTTDRTKLVHGLHKIKANPEKSKNLETATTKIFGLDIDLVNLRKETYSEASRTPEMAFGTPYEDAMRRDATINAMFYNLQDEKVEDLTGQGFDDLENRIIRTPLPPYQTFKDDPLRVLRLIRFASRLSYIIEPESELAMKDETIKEALKMKISRERVGVEFEKMLRGPNPLNALSSIDSLGLYHTIFTDPTKDQPYTPDIGSWHISYNFAGDVVNQRNSKLQGILLPDNESRYLALLLSAFAPWADAPEIAPSKPGAKAPPPRAAAVARECIKATNKVCDIVASSVKNLEDITNIKDGLVNRKRNIDQASKDQDPSSRDTLGMAIRRWGPTWRAQVMYAMIVEHTGAHETSRDVIGEFTTFVSHLEMLDLLSAYDFKPIIDGKTLATALDVKQGPWMKDALDVVMAWQLQYPEEATVDGAIEAVRNKHGELTKRLVTHFLRLTIRLLFSKQQTHNVTAEGRRVTSERGHRKDQEMDEEKPWKEPRNAYALELLTWIVHSLDHRLTEEHWPMLNPPLFALVDDIDVDFKAAGCSLLSQLFRVTSPAMMKRTGLGEVFQSALDPCLSYLPTLTPEDESIRLLSAAYPAILALISLRWRDGSSGGANISNEKVKSLSDLLHENLLPSISHLAESHPRITALLFHQVTACANELEIHSAAHMVHILPLISATVSSPFSAAYPPLLSAVMGTIQTVLANAWPRAYVWKGEMLKAICACWLQIMAEEERWAGNSPSSTGRKAFLKLEDAKASTIVALSMLKSAVAATSAEVDEDGETPGNTVIYQDIDRLVAADERLKPLFTSSIP